MGDHVGGHRGKAASSGVGVGAQADEGFFGTDSELGREHARGLVDLRPVRAQVLVSSVRRPSAGQVRFAVYPGVEQDQSGGVGESQRVGQRLRVQPARDLGVQVQNSGLIAPI